mgnify:CR=1 FL=1
MAGGGLLDNRLDIRAHHLAEAIVHRKALLVEMLRPLGTRPPFTEQRTTEEATEWWLKHRYDETGKAILGTYTPAQIAELDAFLAGVTSQRSQQALLP